MDDTADRVQEIFSEALHMAEGERGAFLDKACEDDEKLREQVRGLLSALDQAGDAGFFDDPTSDVRDEATIAAIATEQPGATIDRYKLLELIGEGGFGAVYMADQKEPVRRRVALKIIKLGMDTKQVIARFEAERQALAMMDHPNIAKVLDAGATSAGRPYFVMELVKGVPITEYCDAENLSTKARLDLFIGVCNAVQHAHQKGIIHRDLKPNNVLITMHDDRPVPKVIDFGIAKATNRELTDKTLFTEFRQFVGTPEYMSPEQAQMSGLDIDTRSDIYALGVLLYELLTGTTPFDARELRAAGLNELQRIIREEEPPKPSTRLSTLGDDITSVAKHRRDDPAHLARSLQGDLDWIVMKALEKNRTRRYETANGFAADIRRHLDNEPVIASPPSATYRFKKLVQRNKGVFAATGIVAAALILGLAVATTGLVSAVRARDAEAAAKDSELEQRVLAEEAQEEAERQRNEAITQSNIAAEQAARTRANSILVAASADEDPLVQALLLTELADVPNMPRRLGVARDVANSPIPMTVLRQTEEVLIEGEIVLSPDGRLLATVSKGTTLIWRTDGTGEPIVRPGIRPSFSGNGMHIVTKEQGRAYVFRTDGAGQPLVLQHEHDVLMAEFSQDGKHIVTIIRNGSVRLWQADGTEELVLLGENETRASAVAFSANSARVAIASDDGVTRVWRTDGSGPPVVFQGPEGRIDAVAFSPDGAEVAIHQRDGQATIWPEDGELHDIVSVWAADGSGAPRIYVRVGSLGGTTQMWRMNGEGDPVALTGYLVPLGLRLAPFGHDLAASADGTLLLDGYWDREARIHRVDGREEALVLSNGNNRVGTAAFNADGTVVAIAGDGPVRIWSIAGASTEPLVFRDHQDWVRGVAFSPDGSLVATASYDGTAHIRRADGAGDIIVLPHGAVVMSVNFSPDGARLVTASHDGAARIWRVDGTGEPLVFPHDGPLEDADFSLDSALIVTGSRDGTARIWNADGSGEPIVLGSTGGRRTPLHSVTFSPDGTKVLVGGPSDTAWLWRADGTGSPIELEGNENMWGGDFSPDGKRIVMGCGDGEVRIWNADGMGEPIVRMEHLDEAFDAAFSPDGARVVTVSQDGTAHVWWVDGSKETLVLRGHGGIVTGAAFSPDGTRVITASKDGTTRIWRVTWPGLRDHLQANVSACLTPEQRMWYLGESTMEAWSRYAECEQEHGRTPDSNLRPGVVSGEEGPSAVDDSNE